MIDVTITISSIAWSLPICHCTYVCVVVSLSEMDTIVHPKIIYIIFIFSFTHPQNLYVFSLVEH